MQNITKHVVSMKFHPNAKINIGLNITNRRPDGYHDIETVFYPVQLVDHVEVYDDGDWDTYPEDSFNMMVLIRWIGKQQDTSSYDALKGSTGDNIVQKALALLRQYCEVPPLEICLTKNIPVGAGLGGGSADAAFFIREVNKRLSLGLTRDQLLEIASKLGSDCAFFIDNTPKYATGRGEILQDVPSVLDGYKIKVIKPLFNISTKEAYSMVKPQKPETSLLEDFRRPVKEWRGLIKNDFEQFLFPLHPELQRYKDALYESGALYASMTGSGSALFGIFEGDPVLSDEIRELAV